MQGCEFLIEIFVPGTDDQPGSIGTGYPVAPDRIITARHVLTDQQGQVSPRIQVRWYYAPETSSALGPPTLRRWIDVDVGTLAFEDNQLDIAVVAFEFPDGLRDWSVLSEGFIAKRTAWLSEGFIEAGKREQRRNAEAFSGTVENDREYPAGTMMLNVTAPPQFASTRDKDADEDHQSESLWRGGSGSPVMANGALAGVITSCPHDYGAARLRAVPIATLLEKKEFREAVKFDDQKRWREEIKYDAEQIILVAMRLCDALTRQIRVGNVANLPAQKAKDVVAGLLNLRIGEFLQLMDTVHESLIDRRFREDSETLLRLTHLLMPGLRGIAGQHVYASDGDAGLRNWTSARMLTLPTACPTVAEVLMANRESRQARFKAAGKRADYPEGEYKLDDRKLPTGIEGGINPSLESDVAAAIDFLKRGCELISSDDLRDPHTDEYYIQLLKNELESRRKKKKSCYFAIRIPSADGELKRVEDLIRRLKELFPAITFIRLAENEDLLLSERDLYRPLRDMHSRRQID